MFPLQFPLVWKLKGRAAFLWCTKWAIWQIWLWICTCKMEGTQCCTATDLYHDSTYSKGFLLQSRTVISAWCSKNLFHLDVCWVNQSPFFACPCSLDTVLLAQFVHVAEWEFAVKSTCQWTNRYTDSYGCMLLSRYLLIVSCQGLPKNLQKTGLAHAHIFPIVEWLYWITTRGHWIYHHSQWLITLWLLDDLWNAANIPTDGPNFGC